MKHCPIRHSPTAPVQRHHERHARALLCPPLPRRKPEWCEKSGRAKVCRVPVSPVTRAHARNEPGCSPKKD